MVYLVGYCGGTIGHYALSMRPHCEVFSNALSDVVS